MHCITLIILFTLLSTVGKAQQQNYTAFTTKDGLPSNHIYQCVEDNHGFLWVATDAGIARFDGRYFQVFTTEHGLPDNEVLQVVKDNNGTIWVNCFRQSPAYFDEVKNRFINAREDSNLAKIAGTTSMNLFVLDEGVMYHNVYGSFVLKNKKFKGTSNFFFLKEIDNASFLIFTRYWNDSAQASKTYLVLNRNEQHIDSVTINLGPTRQVSWLNNNGRLYLFDATRRKCFIVSDLQSTPLRCKIDSATIPESYFSFSFTPDCFYVISNSAKIYVFDKATMQSKYVLSGDYLPNNFYNDSKGNRWISTIDKGLLLLRKKNIIGIEMPLGFTHTNFISIALKKDGSLLAGNYYGEVVEASQNKFIVHKVVDKKPSRLKKILIFGKDVYTISDAVDGIFINYKKQLLNSFNGFTPTGGKTGVVCNDTLIIVGTAFGIMKINTKEQNISNLIRLKRATALARANDLEIYFGSTDGLYKFNYATHEFKSLARNHNLLSERITAICTTNDGLVWVSTSGNGLMVLQNDKVIQNITINDGIIDNSARCLTVAKNQVWFGSSKGISIINYKLNNGKLHFTIANLSINDGLAGTEINEMVYRNDTVYAATGNGISVIPVNTYLPAFDIPVKLVKMSINETDTIITNNYKLGYKRQNIQMQFAAIELDGHFKNLQYTLDKANGWTDLINNVLTLQLTRGDHILQVRAVDVNGNISNKILTIRFSIATPFWKTFWFWITVAILLQLVIAYLIHRWQKKRKEAKLAREIAGVQTASLEQQAFTSLMNPHFMFNALNSIQHYINVQDRQNANRYLTDFASLIRKNFESVQQPFIPLEQELENLKIYLRLEQMRFKERFTYHITIDETIDTEDWMIPTMMLQPILENALLHGLMPSALPGELHIELKKQDKALLIAIKDNGIGITNSLALKQYTNHKSHGMELIRKRMAALSFFVKHPISYNMSPVFDDIANPGNKITIIIPYNLHNAWLKAQQPV